MHVLLNRYITSIKILIDKIYKNCFIPCALEMSALVTCDATCQNVTFLCSIQNFNYKVEMSELKRDLVNVIRIIAQRSLI